MRNLFIISTVLAGALVSGSVMAAPSTNSLAVQKASAGMSYMKVLADKCHFTRDENALLESMAMFAMAGLQSKGPVLTPDIEQGGLRGAMAAESAFKADPGAACKEARDKFADFAKLAKQAPVQSLR
jgi:hemerythrin-like domain-containing protein